jgi:sec-independent protein translocase protein TatC
MKDKTKKMNLFEHLEELRWTLFKIIGSLAFTTLLSLYFIDYLYGALMRPVAILQEKQPDFNVEIIYSGPFDPVFIVMKTAFLGGVILALPIVLLFLWSFIAPGLKKSEKYAFLWICGAGTFSFLLGVVFGYFLVAPVLEILTTFGMEGAKHLWKINDFITFMMYWLIGAGIIFELPLAIVILTKIGVVEVTILKKIRPFFFIGAFAVAAIITPPDPFTMAVVGIPLVLLYEVGIMIASIGNKSEGDISD